MKRKQMRKFSEHGGQARVLAFVAFRVFRPLIWLLITLGQIVFMPIQQAAHARALDDKMVFATGYNPAGQNTSNLPQSQVIYYDKNFVENLKANTPFVRCAARRELPEQSGNQHRLFMYNTLAANTTQVGEGTVGAPTTVSVVNNTSTIGQYADYVNVSDIALTASIDPALENIQTELAYRLGLSLSTLVMKTADGASAVDSSVNGGNKLANQPFGRADINTNVQSMAGRNVKPFYEGRYCGVVHPFIVGDALNDASLNGVSDILKRSAEGQERLAELPSPDGDEVPVLEWAGVRFHSSTMVTQTANYLSSGKTALRTYIFGKDGVIAISLGKREGSQIGNGDWRNLKLWAIRAGDPTVADPARVIGGWTSYNVKFTTTLPPDTTMRLRTVDAVSNVT